MPRPCVAPERLRLKFTPEQTGLGEATVVPPVGVPAHGAGGVKVYCLPVPGHAVLELLAVVVLVVCVVVVMLWKLVAVVPLIPTDAELVAPPTLPYRNSITFVDSYNQACIVLFAAPVVLRGIVTNH